MYNTSSLTQRLPHDNLLWCSICLFSLNFHKIKGFTFVKLGPTKCSVNKSGDWLYVLIKVKLLRSQLWSVFKITTNQRQFKLFMSLPLFRFTKMYKKCDSQKRVHWFWLVQSECISKINSLMSLAFWRFQLRFNKTKLYPFTIEQYNWIYLMHRPFTLTITFKPL